MKKLSLLAILIAFFINVSAQENLDFQVPDASIKTLIDAPATPGVLIDDANENAIILFRDQFKTIDELSKKELRLAGLRIDPKTNIGSRVTYWNNVKVKSLNGKNNELRQVTGLPKNPRLTNFRWSKDEKYVALTNTTYKGVEVWLLDVAKASVSKLTEARANANMGNPISWFADSKSLLIKMVPEDRKDLIDEKEAIPSGPTISVNDGKKAQNRTYQDLLKNKNDEHNFEQLALSELNKVDLKGNSESWMETNMYRGASFSPDGEYVLLTTIKKPFSYLVPYYRFPSETSIYSKNGKKVQVLIDLPLIEDLPQGFNAVRTGRRNFQWREDKASNIVYVEALDGGDPENEVDFRDEMFELEAPFNGEGKSMMKTKNRFSGVIWGDDENAVVYSWWWKSRLLTTYLMNPSNPGQEVKILNERNYQDRYSDPGSFVTSRNKLGEDVLDIVDGNVFLMGDGFTKEGQFPFLDKLDLKKNETTRLYRSEYKDKLESLRDYEAKNNRLLVRIQSPEEFPNYYFRELDKKELKSITQFENPFKSIEGIHKEVIKYKREDGVELSGTLYLPKGYDMEKKEKLPMILWAYPNEFKDKSSAGQNTKNPNEFTYLFWGSPIYWITKGYAILDDASFPIIGEGDKEPNDSFREQLVSNAKAAIDAVDDLGYIDRNKVAVGGHSYGAFMVANLLSHSDLFAAGIARSGAYNRTLTPFGFQSEERNYWQAPEVYYTMSPFMHADKMKTPLLLIHGTDDNNSGTYPMQSERYFNALKGLGATVRLVMLPKESHGYRAKENIYHMLWEQDQWLEKHVKNRGE